MNILHTALYILSKVLTRRILFTNQNFLSLVIISFILMTLMCDSGVIFCGEI